MVRIRKKWKSGIARQNINEGIYKIFYAIFV